MGADGGGDGTVGKALDVLDRVAEFGRPVRFSELLAGGPYPKATLYRFLQTLTHQGMLAYDPAKRISAREALEHPYFRDRARPTYRLEVEMQHSYDMTLKEEVLQQ
jgi:serine/threonine protein kinase